MFSYSYIILNFFYSRSLTSQIKYYIYMMVKIISSIGVIDTFCVRYHVICDIDLSAFANLRERGVNLLN